MERFCFAVVKNFTLYLTFKLFRLLNSYLAPYNTTSISINCKSNFTAVKELHNFVPKAGSKKWGKTSCIAQLLGIFPTFHNLLWLLRYLFSKQLENGVKRREKGRSTPLFQSPAC